MKQSLPILAGLTVGFLIGMAFGVLVGRELMREELRQSLADAFAPEPTPTPIQLELKLNKPADAALSSDEIPPTGTAMPTEQPTPAAISEPELVHVAPGEEFSGEVYRIRISDGHEALSLEPSNQFGEPVYANSSAKFVVVNFEITNITTTPIYFECPFVLVDALDRQFRVETEATHQLENDLLYESLAPGIRESGSLAFEVPRETESYGLLLRKGDTQDFTFIRLR